MAGRESSYVWILCLLYHWSEEGSKKTWRRFCIWTEGKKLFLNEETRIRQSHTDLWYDAICSIFPFVPHPDPWLNVKNIWKEKKNAIIWRVTWRILSRQQNIFARIIKAWNKRKVFKDNVAYKKLNKKIEKLNNAIKTWLTDILKKSHVY